MTPSDTTSRIWKTAHLQVAFHVDQSGKQRDHPKVWSPKNATAAIHVDPHKQEAFVRLVAAQTGATSGGDVRVNFRADRIAVTRETGPGWHDIEIGEASVDLRIGDTVIRILPDASVVHVVEDRVTFIEADGGVLKVDGLAEAAISADLCELVQRTHDTIAVIDPDGPRIGPRKHVLTEMP